ncbi:MAG: hypothetical protein QOE90_230 [Thermoplasmata archaeon]|jgi:hypothetical protein|nr:hypothetical protein [Thermoplasmata archaeon]
MRTILIALATAATILSASVAMATPDSPQLPSPYVSDVGPLPPLPPPPTPFGPCSPPPDPVTQAECTAQGDELAVYGAIATTYGNATAIEENEARIATGFVNGQVNTTTTLANQVVGEGWNLTWGLLGPVVDAALAVERSAYGGANQTYGNAAQLCHQETQQCNLPPLPRNPDPYATLETLVRAIGDPSAVPPSAATDCDTLPCGWGAQ